MIDFDQRRKELSASADTLQLRDPASCHLPASSMILMPELVPSRDAPACSICSGFGVGLDAARGLDLDFRKQIGAHQPHVFDGRAGRAVAGRCLHEVRPHAIRDLAGADLFFVGEVCRSR